MLLREPHPAIWGQRKDGGLGFNKSMWGNTVFSTDYTGSKLITLSEFDRMTWTGDLFLSQFHVNEFRVPFMAFVLLFRSLDWLTRDIMIPRFHHLQTLTSHFSFLSCDRRSLPCPVLILTVKPRGVSLHTPTAAESVGEITLSAFSAHSFLPN